MIKSGVFLTGSVVFTVVAVAARFGWTLAAKSRTGDGFSSAHPDPKNGKRMMNSRGNHRFLSLSMIFLPLFMGQYSGFVFISEPGRAPLRQRATA
jgi:hypothetical protein